MKPIQNNTTRQHDIPPILCALRDARVRPLPIEDFEEFETFCIIDNNA